MLTIWRRHTRNCPHKAKGRDYLKCACPIWADGYNKGVRNLRKSLGTKDMARARKIAAALESPDSHVFKSVEDATAQFLNRCLSDGLASETYRKYRNSLRHLVEVCSKHGIDQVSEINVEFLDTFRASRKLAPITSVKELQLLRQFCEFCRDRKWMEHNPAKSIKPPRNIKPNDTEPFSAKETEAIIGACFQIGQHDYERLRAHAMILTLRYTALRLGDVALLEKDRISKIDDRWRIFLRTDKNGKLVFLPIPQEMKEALDKVPTPRGVHGESRYYFWNRISSERGMKKSADDTLRSVFKKSGVAKAHAHRFRHTLATEMLENGATFEEVADVLGNTPEVVREHYAKWSPKRQARIDDLMERVHSSATYKPQLLRVK